MQREIVYRDPSELKASPRNARIHLPAQINRIEQSLNDFTFVEPVIIDAVDQIVVGHARTQAAKQAGIASIPTIRLDDLSPAQVRAYRIASNRLAELSSWDDDLLQLELSELDALELEFDLTSIGFETAELDRLLGNIDLGEEDEEAPPPAPRPEQVIAARGDQWLLDRHRLFVGDFTSPTDMAALMLGERARMILADVPYNIHIPGVVSGLGKAKHRDFVQGSGEMTDAEFTRFLSVLFRNLLTVSMPGSLHYIFMDFRSLLQLLRAGNIVYDELKAIVTWVKASGGMGSLYRHRAEFITVFKHGAAPHVNNIELGRHGRNRTTVWEYGGMNSFQSDRDELLAMHPTPKPVQMCADAILDCTHRGDIVLDPCVGSGTTILAAEQTDRRCYAMELDPIYADVTLRRFHQKTGNDPIRAADGRSFSSLDESQGSKTRRSSAS